MNPDDQSENRNGCGESDDQHDIGAHQAEQQRAAADGCEEQSVEVSVLDVEHQRVGAADTGDREHDGHRQLERLVVEARGEAALHELLQGSDVDHEEEHGDDERGQKRLGVAPREPDRSQ